MLPLRKASKRSKHISKSAKIESSDKTWTVIKSVMGKGAELINFASVCFSLPCPVPDGY
jgi:hypothetical protein